MVPEVGRQIDSNVLTKVVLPARFGPRTPNTEPRGTSSVTARRAWMRFRPNRPAR